MISEKTDKANDPAYSGGEDENGAGHKQGAQKEQRQSKRFPVDESDEGPATAPDDTGEGG